MRVTKALRKRTGLGMTPMIDMAFLLITFFVMTLRLTASQEEKVTLPRADQDHTHLLAEAEAALEAPASDAG